MPEILTIHTGTASWTINREVLCECSRLFTKILISLQQQQGVTPIVSHLQGADCQI